MGKMKIAFFVIQFPTVSETFILNQICGLLDRGHDVRIFAHFRGNDPVVHPDVETYGLLDRTKYIPPVPAKRWSRLSKAISLCRRHGFSSWPRLIKSANFFRYGRQAASLGLLFSSIPFLDRGDFDIVHCHFGPTGLTAVLLREIGLLKGKILTTFHGVDVNVYPALYGEGAYQKLFERGDLYTVNTAFTAEKVVALGCPREKIVKLPVGLNMSNYQYRPRFPNETEDIKVLTVGRLEEKKGIEYSIRAFQRAQQAHPNLQYLIVGDGVLRDHLNRVIKELNLSDKVQLLGWKTQDQLQSLYAEAHLFVLASVTSTNGDQEGQGLVLQEAQAAGLPVVSTLHNGIPEGVLDGRSGFLVQERDIDALAGKLIYLIEHPELWSEMGKAGRNFVECQYDINRLNERLVAIYEGLLTVCEETFQERYTAR